MSYSLFPMAGFQVTIHGRFWVTAEGEDSRSLSEISPPAPPLPLSITKYQQEFVAVPRDRPLIRQKPSITATDERKARFAPF